ncbi:helix-turn-helix transcriptional regulator [Eubacterium sp.]|uniref:helix-turn-helix domain-containing protein n=1 Tax=Eubacterium sp. TaxID=142586 RepID=UPI0025F7D3C3|nr:helix-turn-helix transcriptional regulator [Eubacterium sp.]MCR5630076.1 helix-turn-helix transcriptional regulator [Eubacterium sp.]
MQTKKEDFIDIGLRIKQARENKSMTQEAFAEKIGVTPQFISDVERAVVGISVPTLKKVCLTLGCSSDFLIFGKADSSYLSSITQKIQYMSEGQLKAAEQVIDIMADSIPKNDKDTDKK